MSSLKLVGRASKKAVTIGIVGGTNSSAPGNETGGVELDGACGMVGFGIVGSDAEAIGLAVVGLRGVVGVEAAEEGSDVTSSLEFTTLVDATAGSVSTGLWKLRHEVRQW